MKKLSKISNKAKTFWVLLICMIINLMVMFFVVHFIWSMTQSAAVHFEFSDSIIWHAYAIGGVVFSLNIIPAVYVLLYIYVSLRFGRYICEWFKWDYEPLFDLVVLGIPDFVLFWIYWGISASVFEASGFWESVGNAFRLIFSGGSVLSIVSATLVIAYPLCLIFKTPFTKAIMRNYTNSDERAREFLRCGCIVDAFASIAPAHAANYLRDSFNKMSKKTYGLNDAIRILKSKPRNVVTNAVIMICIILTFGWFFIYEPIQYRMLDVGSQTIEGTRNYDDAFELLELINVKRGSRRPELAMDAKLMEAAMLRAAECVVDYSHTRPSGRAGTSVYPNARSEIIAVGQQDAEALMQILMDAPRQAEASAKYRSEDVFRNGRTSFNSNAIFQILLQNDVYHSVGIGCFEPEDGEDGERYLVILLSRGITRNTTMPDNQEVSQVIRYRRTMI